MTHRTYTLSSDSTGEVLATLDEAQFHLHLAAPDLLAALENLVEREFVHDTDGDHYDEILDAIAKAKGGAL